MRALILIHRWLGVAFCLVFAMWFATGIVMHFVPFPALTEAERIAGLAPIDPAALRHEPGAALSASEIQDATRVRLFARNDGPVYLVQNATGVRAFYASDLSPAGVGTEKLALAIAVDHARRRGIATAAAAFAELADYDQWTVSGGLDPHRPLYRIALNDAAATELYVSSATGEIVRDTTRSERAWNYAGSVLHWIYPTILRKHLNVWLVTVWILSLIALIAGVSGAVLGVLRVQLARGRIASPYRGWQAWHHWLGLGSMAFLLTWIFSGWLSMDHGLLFSTGKLSAQESAAMANPAGWNKFPAHELQFVSKQAREIEWFALGEHIYQRERYGLDEQSLSRVGAARIEGQTYLQPAEVATAAQALSAACMTPVPVAVMDDYPVSSKTPDAPVYRIVCGDTWFHVDGASGAPLEKLDASRRAYRWLYQALHTLDFPALNAHTSLRTALIVLLCALGVVFSVTAVVIGWRRLRA